MFVTEFNKEEKIWCGLNIPPLYSPQITVAQALFNSMSIFGSKIAQISDDTGIRMTFDEIHIKSIRAAQNLQALGYKPKDIFTLIARNSHHLAPITFALFAIGCPVNALDPSFKRTELIHMMKITKPKVVFCDVAGYKLADECLKELGNEASIFTFGGRVGRSESVESLFKETQKEDEFIPVKVDGPNETAMIICSSGTTGLSKEVCLSHAAILDSMSRFPLESTDVMLCFSSLYWISGLMALVRPILFGATKIITTQIFSPELQIRLIEEHKVTFTINASHQLVLMTKCDRFNSADLSSLKCLLVGGSKVPNYIVTALKPHLPNGYVIPGYGMSETVGPMTFDYPASKEDSVGRLMSGCYMKVIDGHGNKLGVNEDGELCIKMAYRFLGYYDNPQVTADAFDEDGFIVSGDVGHFDEHGNLFITGRKKELLKYYNFPIAPAEIDAYLTESPEIASACVVGVPDPMGDLPAAVIVRAQGSNISEKEVSDMVAGHFADHHKLRGGVYFVDALPTTPSGKVLRRNVTETAVQLFNAQKA